MFIELGDNLINLYEVLSVRPYGEKCTDLYFKGKDKGLLIYLPYQEALKIIKAALEPPVEAVEFGGLKDVKPE